MSKTTLKLLLPALTGALLIAAWYAVHFWVISEDRRFLLPTPGAILGALHDHAPYLARAAYNTAKGALLGFGLAVVVSFALALLLSLSPAIRASLYPYLMAVQLTPLPVLAPICVIWVGAGLKS